MLFPVSRSCLASLLLSRLFLVRLLSAAAIPEQVAR